VLIKAFKAMNLYYNTAANFNAWYFILHTDVEYLTTFLVG